MPDLTASIDRIHQLLPRGKKVQPAILSEVLSEVSGPWKSPEIYRALKAAALEWTARTTHRETSHDRILAAIVADEEENCRPAKYRPIFEF